MQTYKNKKIWKKIQNYLPKHNRITKDFYPVENYWEWHQNNIHIDFYPNPSSKVKIILLHGIGGNGRLLSFIGIPLYKHEYEVICPDLPGYGLTQIEKSKFNYPMWVNLVKDLIEYESKKDDKDIILFGLSAGGMLAYHAGNNNEKVSGLIFTNLLDQRIPEVRDSSGSNKFISKIAIHFLYILNSVNGKIKLPMKMVVNMKAIVNEIEMLKLLIKDDKSSGVRVPVKFITSMLDYVPEVEPENYKGGPVLLVHPEDDRWTDIHLSMLTFNKFRSKKEVKILEKAGHFPIEQPGLYQLEEYIINFIEDNFK